MEFKPIITTQEGAENATRLLIRQGGAVSQVALFKGLIPSQKTKQSLPSVTQGSDKNKLNNSVSNLIITLPTYTDSNGVLNDNAKEKIIFDTVIFDIERQKNIIRTPIQGRNGTIKEYIADDDWAINIKIILAGQNGEYPKNQLTDLLTALNAPVELEVESWFLDQFGIKSIVCMGDSYPVQEGSISYQVVNISAISEQPIELKISK